MISHIKTTLLALAVVGSIAGLGQEMHRAVVGDANAAATSTPELGSSSQAAGGSAIRAMTAAEKLAGHWQKIVATAGIRTKRATLMDRVRGFLNLNAPFNETTEVISKTRRKLIHPDGVTAQVRFVPAPGHQANGTGFFGGDPLLARLAPARSPYSENTNMVPGAAVKVFRDGSLPSHNGLFISSLDGQGNDARFFLPTLSNLVREPSSPAGKFGARLFEFASGREEAWVPIDHIGTLDGRGMFRIDLVPTEEARAFVPYGLEPAKLLETMETIPEGTALYDVRVFPTKPDSDVHRGTLVGTIRTESAMIASSHGDSLSFRHRGGGSQRSFLRKMQARGHVVARIAKDIVGG